MKKIYRLFTALLAVALPLAFQACSSDDEFSTEQFNKKEVALNVYGPNPVMRGGTLRFIGSNLDKIVKVQIPGVSDITDITVRQSGVPSEILVQVPKDGPEVGYVTLVTSDGKEIVTTSELTYSESIEFTSFSPASVMPGDVLTISGDYLTLVNEVIFADEQYVSADDFLSQSRYTITLTVPETAQTGQVILSDGAEELPNWIYSEDDLTVGTATVTKVAASRYKAGETITFTGTYLNLVSEVVFSGATVTDFTVSSDAKTLTLTQPAAAADGAITMVMKSGVEIEALADFAVVVPSSLSVSPSPVKNGASLTVKGSDLDLVTSVSFTTTSGTTDAGETTVSASSVVIAAVPTAAIDGALYLNMANGMSVAADYTLVAPTVSAYSANPVSAGAELTITGQNLDLVSTVAIGGEAATPSAQSETSLTITVPMDSQSGAVTLNLLSGASLETTAITVEEAVFCYVTAWPEETMASNEIAALTVANYSVLTEVQVNGSAVQYVLLSDKLYVGLPAVSSKAATLTLVSSNGSITYDVEITPATEVTTVIWTGAESIYWSGMQALAWGGYDWSTVSAGTVLTAYFTLDTSYDYWQIRFGNGSWSALPGTDDVISLEAGATSYSITLTQAMIDELVNAGGLVMTGTNYTLTKLTLL